MDPAMAPGAVKDPKASRACYGRAVSSGQQGSNRLIKHDGFHSLIWYQPEHCRH
jgi:hypothetical protein